MAFKRVTVIFKTKAVVPSESFPGQVNTGCRIISSVGVTADRSYTTDPYQVLGISYDIQNNTALFGSITCRWVGDHFYFLDGAGGDEFQYGFYIIPIYFRGPAVHKYGYSLSHYAGNPFLVHFHHGYLFQDL